jgi:hypothetical protein
VVWAPAVTVPFQPMSAMAISLAWVVVAVVPVDAGGVLPLLVAITSSGEGEAPVTSSTLKAIAEVEADVPPTVTVTTCEVARPAALAAYQISPSAWDPLVTPAARSQWSPAFESTTLLTRAKTVALRVLMVATRRSPAVVATLGEAERVALPDVFRAPND